MSNSLCVIYEDQESHRYEATQKCQESDRYEVAQEHPVSQSSSAVVEAPILVGNDLSEPRLLGYLHILTVSDPFIFAQVSDPLSGSLKGELLPSRFIDFLNTQWTPLADFVQTNIDLISTKYPLYSPMEIKSISSYLKTILSTPKTVDLEISESKHDTAFNFKYSQLTPTRKWKEEHKDLNLFLCYGKIQSVCMIFESHYTLDGGEELCIADYLRSLITNLNIDLQECGAFLGNYYDQHMTRFLPQATGYESQLCSWAVRLEHHRIRIQTTLALYSFLYLGSSGNIFIDGNITLAFGIFPELDPFCKGLTKHDKYAFDSRIFKIKSAAELDKKYCTRS
ncbi:hypothetical protein JR316_0001641 [Psilocybe cubensis]|uniref:Uncharacterized protein n=2 Tax=Psilocybe cubensis TaxID=181762 RepID=A0ACB8HA44_PSICU|nr:hypothetical protein JR316_0001641 [Psilocybe cubensis]KAH9484741.1 hypothetical protein JR316_0001641 [Psilocybe cubensis]